MTELNREAQVMRTFGVLADTLVVDYDVVDLLQTLVDSCHDLLNATAAGILLIDDQGYLEVVASTSEAPQLIELLQLSSDNGPSGESFDTGLLVQWNGRPRHWPEFTVAAVSLGFHSATIFPLLLRETTIGTLVVFGESSSAMSEYDAVAARAFADVATIGILHERALRESTIVREQLQSALNSRIIIEQAKGMIAHTRNVTMDTAFDLIRTYARTNSLGLGAVAVMVVERRLAV